MTFINVSNHPSSKWSNEQKKAALKLADSIVDLPFPQVPADADTQRVRGLAHGIIDYVTPICHGDSSKAVVMIAGETSVCFYAIRSLLNRGFRVVVACSDRVSEEVVQPDGSTKKVAVFKFVQFRDITI